MLRIFREKEFRHPLLIWLMILCWYLFLGRTLFSAPQTKLADIVDTQAFWLLNDPPPQADEITIVAIDRTSRKELDVKWPWDRSLTAKLIRNLADLSPRVIGLDIVFSGASEPSQDRELVSALASHPGIVLGYSRQGTVQDRPEKGFAEVAASTGFVDKPLEDGCIRNVLTYDRDKAGNARFSLDVELLKGFWELNGKDVDIDPKGLSLRDKLFIPSPQGHTRLNYLVYPTHFKIVPASHVINRSANPADFEDKIVLVGATDPLIHDEHPTVLGTLPGVTILANSVVMLLSKRFIQPAPPGSGLLITLALGGVILIVNRAFNVLRASFISVGLLILVYFTFLFLRRIDVTVPYFLILYGGASAFLAFNGYKYLSLIYMTNKIKGQAILDPLTGLYAPRYFLLRLRRQLKTRRPFTYAGIRIENYQQLSVSLDFDQLKGLLHSFSKVLVQELDKHFFTSSASRFCPDTFIVELENETRDKVERFWSDLLAGVTDLVREAGCEKTPIVVKGGFIFKAKAAAGATNDLVSQMKELLNKSPENTYLNEVFEPAKAGASEASPEDMLDFIAFDWEERNKELETHVRKLVETNQELNRLNWGTLNALARTIDAKSPWTAGHSERVTRFALLIGSKLNLGDPELEQLRRGALLHDIGKIAISRDILDKPGKLTDREYKIICEHPARGARILEPIESYADIIAIVKQHHEWFNGQGYPNKIAGETIALGARILAVADVYDALTSERPYRSGMSHDRAAEIIIKGKGTQFDPMVVEAFLQVTATDNIVWREDRSAPIDSPRATGPDHWSYTGPHRQDLTDSSPR